MHCVCVCACVDVATAVGQGREREVHRVPLEAQGLPDEERGR